MSRFLWARLSLLNLCFCLCLLQTTSSFGSQCSELFSNSPLTLHYLEPKTTISTPESLPHIQKAIGILDSMMSAGKTRTSYRAKFYSLLLPGLESTTKLGESLLRQKASDQNEVLQ